MVQQLIKFITKDEFNKLMKAEKNKKYKLIYILMFGSGLRISEVLGYDKIKPITKEQINLGSHQIRILGKRNKERITTTSPMLKESHLNMLPLKINRRTFQYHLSKLSEKVLGKKISPHQFRHGFANFMANEKNVPLPMVQSMLGHSRLDTTGIYTKSNPIQAINTAWESF